MIDLDRLEALLGAATELWVLGESENVVYDDPMACWHDCRDNGSDAQHWATCPGRESVDLARRDATLVVALRNAAPQLLAELRAAREEIEKLRATNALLLRAEET